MPKSGRFLALEKRHFCRFHRIFCPKIPFCGTFWKKSTRFRRKNRRFASNECRKKTQISRDVVKTARRVVEITRRIVQNVRDVVRRKSRNACRKSLGRQTLTCQYNSTFIAHFTLSRRWSIFRIRCFRQPLPDSTLTMRQPS